MTTLYDIGDETIAQLDNLQQRLENGEDFSTPEKQEELQKILACDDWKEKMVNVAKYLVGVEGEIELLKAEKDKLDRKTKSRQQTVAYMKDLMKGQMLTIGIDKIDDLIMPVKLNDNPNFTVAIKDESLIPEQYIRVKTTKEIDKKALLKNREKIDFGGVEFVKEKHIRIG